MNARSTNTEGAPVIPGWSEIGELIPDGGHVGGDLQDGPAANRRFATKIDGREPVYTVVDFYVYWAREEDADKRWIQVQVYCGTCTDLEDVGGTEITGDYRYWDGLGGDDPVAVCASLGDEDIFAALDQMG